MIVILCCLLVFSITNKDVHEEHIKGIKDMFFIWFTPLNEYYRKNPKMRDYLIIFSSTCIDIMMLIAFYRFARYATTYRLMICMALFYSTRIMVQILNALEFPKGNLWTFPGIYSLMIPYGETHDFFYSGHVGICMI